MKKFISILIAFATIFNICVAAASAKDDYLYDIVSLGILTGDENGDLKLDSSMTRAELVVCVARLLDFDSLSEEMTFDNIFEDVDPEAWYADTVNMMAALGIVNGTTATTFEPNAEVQMQQVVKILINVLGYGTVAENRGGYPDGYISLASSLGLLKNVKASPFTREGAAVLIYNALDVEILEDWGNKELSKDGNTLRGYLMREKSEGTLIKGRGIVTANADTYLLSPDSDFEDDELEINGTIYKNAPQSALSLLGQEVWFYALEQDNGDNVLVSVKATDKNIVTEIDDNDLLEIKKNELLYLNSGKRRTKLAFDASCKIVKNGRMLDQFGTEDLALYKGKVTAIDNNDDGNEDVLLIEDYSNVKVDEIIGNTIVLYGDDRVNGKKYITVDDDDDDVRIVIYDADGARMSVADIAANSIISAVVSADGTFQKLTVCEDCVEGTIKSASSDEIYVDDDAYKLHENDTFDFSLNDDVIVRLDYRGYVADIEKSQSLEKYAYVIASEKKDRLSSVLELKMVFGSQIVMRYQKNEEDEDDTKLIPSIVCKNEKIETLDAADKLKIDGTKFTGDSVPTGLYQYSMNADGEIASLTTSIFAGGGNAMKYNVYDKTFGENNANEPIGIDEKTMVICLPKNTDASEEDYLVPLEINDKVTARTFDVYGYDFDESTKKVKMIVFEEIMDNTSLPVVDPVTGSPLVAMVKKITSIKDDDGELAQKIVLVTNSGEQEHIVTDIEGKNSFFADLKRGDLIYYAKDLDGMIANFDVIYSFAGTKKVPFYKNKSAVDEQIFGYVTNVEYDEIDGARNILVNEVEMMSDDLVSIDVKKRNAPPVFIYESRDNITLGSIRDILPSSSDEYLFMLRPYSVDVRACVIVK